MMGENFSQLDKSLSVVWLYMFCICLQNNLPVANISFEKQLVLPEEKIEESKMVAHQLFGD